MTAQQHAARDHAQWSASSTERHWQCAGSLALEDGLPEKTSEAADWGTCAHQIAEKCLRGHGPADRYIGKTEKGKSYSFEVDEEMAETAQTYVDYVQSVSESDPDAQMWVEQQFSLAALSPPFEAGGTADAVIYLPGTKRIEVIDLKGGRGHVVEAVGNPQARTYALGAMLAHQGLDVERVTVTIVQPRAPHKDGRTRSETFHIADLVEWTSDLVAAMRRAAEADAERTKMSPAGWAKAFLTPGDHCKFCKARGTCPALEKAAMDAAGIYFDDLDQPHIAANMEGDDPAKLSRDLDMLDMIEGWCNARRERAHQLAESGVEIPNYVLVAKQGREKWTDAAAEGRVHLVATEAGVPREKWLNDPKLRTPKQVREAFKKAGKDDFIAKLAPLSDTPSGGTNLVKSSKTTRQPVAAAVHQHFSAIE